MSAYVIGQINIINQNQYPEYMKQTSPLVEKYGGKFLVRGGKFNTVWGKNEYSRHVIIEFPSYEIAMNWYNSKEYEPIKRIREENAVGNLIIIEGY